MPTETPRAASTVADALRNFDELPDFANVRVAVVAALYDVGPATVWRWSRTGRLPAPRKIGPKVTAWNVGALRRSLVEYAAKA